MKPRGDRRQTSAAALRNQQLFDCIARQHERGFAAAALEIADQVNALHTVSLHVDVHHAEPSTFRAAW
jgi:hypothetical protein